MYLYNKKTWAEVYARVIPLDLSEVRPGDNARRKGQLYRNNLKSIACIVNGCCSVQQYGSVLCAAHRKGLGLPASAFA